MQYKVNILTNGVAIAPLVIINNKKSNQLICTFKELINKAKLKLKQLTTSFNYNQSIDVLAFFSSFISDPYFIKEVKKRIRKGYPLDDAISMVLDDLISFENNKNKSYEQNIKTTISDLKAFLLSLNNEKVNEFNSDVILYYKKLTLSDLDINTNYIKGIIIEELTPESHLLILARTLSIPVVINSKIKAKNNDLVIISSFDNSIITKPTNSEISRYSQQLKNYYNMEQELSLYSNLATRLKDNIKINLAVNISTSSELKTIYNEGIGLVRTEYFFKNDYQFLTQVNGYKELFSGYPNQLPTVRLFDLSSDKVLKNYPLVNKIKRGVGIIKYDKLLYKDQLRAILEAYLELNLTIDLKILIPYVEDKNDILAIKNILNELALDDKYKRIIPKIKLGVMIESIKAINCLSELISLGDFFSLGTSDLICSYFNINRNKINKVKLTNDFFKLVQKIFNLITKSNKEFIVCGDLASTKEGITALIALGIRSFSIASLELNKIRAYLKEVSLEQISQLNNLAKKTNFYEEIITYVKGGKNE